MKKIIVTTTINPPTEAIRKFDEMKGWDLVVIGDLKTPKNYKLKNGIYLSPKDQEKIDKKLSDLIGWNCIQRRNMGLVMAKKLSADIVALIDDDNIPKKNWGKNLLLAKKTIANYYETNLVAFDPIFVTNHSNLWHRGFPLQLVSKRKVNKKKSKYIEADIQADFWDGDPDIDAVCRMIYSPECLFKKKYFPFFSNKISPFNSQNTFITKKILKNYFLFPHIGRMDDIWASFFVQANNAKVIYNTASVYQERNPHDLTVDMKNEYLGYEHNDKMLMKLYKDPKELFKFLPTKSLQAFFQYQKHFNRS